MNDVRYKPLMMQASGEARARAIRRCRPRRPCRRVAENLEHLKLPDMVIGFRVKNTASVNEHLQKLEAILGAGTGQDART